MKIEARLTLAFPTLAQMVDDLITFVNSLGAQVNAPPLLASLNAAEASFLRGNVASAICQLGAFQAKVVAQVQPNDADLAAELVARAQTIIDIANNSH